MSGWPSGLRRQTQGSTLPAKASGCSGPRMRAWVRIPLLTKFFTFHKEDKIQPNLNKSFHRHNRHICTATIDT